MLVEESREKFRAWLTEFVDHFRERVKSLTPEEQCAASRTLEDFSFPCQLVTVWAKEPEFQILLFTHLSDVEDKTVEIYGPIENIKLIECLENEVLNHPLVVKIGKENVERYIINTLRHIQQFYDPLRGPIKPQVDGRTRLSDSPYAVGWLILGNLMELNREELINECIKSIVSAAKPAVTAPSPEEQVILEGFGTYIYPPVWLGPIPEPKSLREKITGFPLWKYSFGKVLVGMYKQFPCILTRDGYIAIGQKDKSKALELLNEIMSTLLVLGVPTYVIRESDLGETTFREMSAQISWGARGLRASLFAERFSMYPSWVERTVIPEEKIGKAIKWAEILTSDARLKTLLLLYLETYTHFMNTEYKQALIMGWVILEEFYAKDLWLSQISKITSDQNRLSKLSSWDIDRQLETLNIAHILPTLEYDLLMKIKHARNEAVHEGKDPEKEVVETCLKLVADVVQKYIGTRLSSVLPTL